MNYEAVEFVDAADLWVQNNFCTANSINTSDNYYHTAYLQHHKDSPSP